MVNNANEVTIDFQLSLVSGVLAELKARGLRFLMHSLIAKEDEPFCFVRRLMASGGNYCKKRA